MESAPSPWEQQRVQDHRWEVNYHTHIKTQPRPYCGKLGFLINFPVSLLMAGLPAVCQDPPTPWSTLTSYLEIHSREELKKKSVKIQECGAWKTNNKHSIQIENISQIYNWSTVHKKSSEDEGYFFWIKRKKEHNWIPLGSATENYFL